MWSQGLHIRDQVKVCRMTTYSIREFKANVSAILRELEVGEQVIITRRGRPCGKLTSVNAPEGGKASLETLRGSLTYLPDAAYEDFLDIKSIWEPRVPPTDGT